MGIEPLSQDEKDAAVESLAHQVAAGIHAMLAWQRVTVAELKRRLSELPDNNGSPALVDQALAGFGAHDITVTFLADVAFALGCEWDFKVAARPTPEVPQAALST